MAEPVADLMLLLQNWDPTAVVVQKRYSTTEEFLDREGKPFRASIFYGVGGNTKVYGAALPRFRASTRAESEPRVGVPFAFGARRRMRKDPR